MSDTIILHCCCQFGWCFHMAPLKLRQPHDRLRKYAFVREQGNAKAAFWNQSNPGPLFQRWWFSGSQNITNMVIIWNSIHDLFCFYVSVHCFHEKCMSVSKNLNFQNRITKWSFSKMPRKAANFLQMKVVQACHIRLWIAKHKAAAVGTLMMHKKNITGQRNQIQSEAHQP